MVDAEISFTRMAVVDLTSFSSLAGESFIFDSKARASIAVLLPQPIDSFLIIYELILSAKILHTFVIVFNEFLQHALLCMICVVK